VKFSIEIATTRDAQFRKREVASHEIHEELRQLGLEWKTADYLFDQTVVIVIRQVPDQAEEETAKQKLAQISEIVDG
jgi:hypothetical protein